MRSAKQAGPPGGEPAGGDNRPSLGGQPHLGGTSLSSGGGGSESAVGPVLGAPSPSTSGDGGQPMGPGKRQRSSEGTPGDRQAKRPKQTG
jgi:hypothetical protein